MIRFSLRLPDELHEKVRWLSYSQRRSQHEIVLEVLEKALEEVKVPKERR